MSCEKREQLPAAEFLAESGSAVTISAMCLKNAFCQVQADNGNVTNRCLLPVSVTLWKHHIGTSDVVGRGHPPHQLSVQINSYKTYF